MKMKDRTKLMFAEELEKMLAVTSLDKVRVLALCRRCGATPPSFYYYFKDKYDLAAWIYLSDISAAFGDREPDYSPERLAQSLELMDKRRSFCDILPALKRGLLSYRTNAEIAPSNKGCFQ